METGGTDGSLSSRRCVLTEISCCYQKSLAVIMEASSSSLDEDRRGLGDLLVS